MENADQVAYVASGIRNLTVTVYNCAVNFNRDAYITRIDGFIHIYTVRYIDHCSITASELLFVLGLLEDWDETRIDTVSEMPPQCTIAVEAADSFSVYYFPKNR